MTAGSIQSVGLYRSSIGRLAVIAGMFVAVLMQQSYGQCGNDNDCKGDRICVNNQCVDPAPTPANVPAPQVEPLKLDTVKPDRSETVGATETPVIEEIDDDDEVRETFAEPGFWDFWFNPIGFIQFGPTAGVEFRTAPNLYIGLHGRYAAMGMLYNLLLEGRAAEETDWTTSIEVDPTSAGVGLELKYYITFPSRPHMLYFGMFGEYMWGGYTAFEDDNYYYNSSSIDTYQDTIYVASHQSIGMGATLGHRWRFGESRKVLLTVGLITGVARPFKNIKEYPRPTGKVNVPKKNEFIFMAEVGIGYGM
ncbi:MAG: hypothetical protein JW913_05240 [Chitinispirillaceae bacterium]|nr:hypothetical protein [Chitinispirillaceae bacterium]